VKVAPSSTLDKLALELFEPTSRGELVCDGLAREAEDGLLTGDFRVDEDSAASAGGYISVPNGRGSDWQAPSDYHKAQYCFTVAEAGEYVIAANVYGTNDGEDSFFVRVDDDASRTFLWDTLMNDSYDVDYVSSRNGADPETLNLSAGEHTVTVYLREDGTRLDTLALESATAEQLIAAADSVSNPSKLMAHGVYGEIVVQPSATQADDAQDFSGFSLTLSGADYSRTAAVMADGTYSFDDMPVGEYTLRLTVPDGYTTSTPAELTVSAQADSAVRVSPEVMRLQSTQRLFVPLVMQ